MRIRFVLATVLLALSVNAADKLPIKVFILAGQSNMQGHGHLKTLDWLGQDATYGSLLKQFKDADGKFVERSDVWIYYARGKNDLKKGNLTVGYGASNEHIGPEVTFGHVLGERYENQVLLIKTAWGGRSLAIDFRPPSAGPVPVETFPEKARENFKAGVASGKIVPGATYREMIEGVHGVLADLKTQFPQYENQGYEIAGFVWFQGWNDMINKEYTAEYEKNLVCLINDVRKDLNVPKLPVVVAVMGVDGKDANEHIQTFRKAQIAACEHPEFKDTVAYVKTADYWDTVADDFLKKNWIKRKWVSEEAKAQWEKMGNEPEYHYLGSAKIQAIIGLKCGEAMNGLLK